LIRLLLLACLACAAAPAGALSREGKEFLEIMRELEPMQCEKRRLRRQITMANAEQKADEARALGKRFAEIDRDPKTSSLEKRLAVLERRISNGKGGTVDPSDLEAISKQQRDAFYRCE
jgi:hypothetical protein